jgi:hypothetical protein
VLHPWLIFEGFVMRALTLGLGLLIALATAEVAQAQFPYQPMPQHVPPPSPLMYVRFTGPKGAKITVYRGSDKGQTLELPATLGFRPGYAYRLAVTDVAAFPRQVFYPSLDIRGTLALAQDAQRRLPGAHQFHRGRVQ